MEIKTLQGNNNITDVGGKKVGSLNANAPDYTK